MEGDFALPHPSPKRICLIIFYLTSRRDLEHSENSPAGYDGNNKCKQDNN